MKRLLLVYFLLTHVHLFGQITEDFSDDNFTANPMWSGDDVLFTIINGELNSQNSGAATYYLSTPSTLFSETKWEFFLNLKFSTSGANFVDVYLISDVADLTTTMNGYFVRIGNTSDEISLYSILGGVETVIINGTDKTVNSSSNNPFNVRVTRDASDLWLLEVDDGASGSYISEGSVIDNSVSNSSYFGIKIKQSTAKGPINNHFFDNISISAVIPDVQAPMIIDVLGISNLEIDVRFDENVDRISSETMANYSINRGIGEPSSASLDAVDNSLVHLIFSNPLMNNVEYELLVENIKDLNENAIATEVSMFTILIPELANVRDLVINEIMADPTPMVGLPNSEYIEIHNRSNKYIDLANYALGTTRITTNSHIIGSDEYVILCENDNASLLRSFGSVLGISSWNTLTNGGERITLNHIDNSLIIDEVTFNDSWYNSIDKRDGGWSLELIDPENRCGEENNWSASIDQSGGTPGNVNSIFGSKPDLIGPKLLSATAITQDSLILSFDERLDTLTFKSVTFTFEPTLSIDHSIISNDLREVTIIFSRPLKPSVAYNLVISKLRDCNRNIIDKNNSQEFVLAEVAGKGDLLINELLYNPITSGGDFVEIYNYSPKFIDLKGWMVANGSDENPENVKSISENHLLILPQQYLVLTEDPSAVAADYPRAVLENFIEVSRLPSFPNEGQGVVLLNPDETVIDYFLYDNDMQHALLDDDKGVSLERISFSNPTNDRNNWHSAAKSEGFATSGYVNSQSFNTKTPTFKNIVVSPKVFLPNQSGQNDFVTINYSFDQPGFVANVSIIDHIGRVIREIAQNELLATKGFFQWDGTMNNGRKARSGVYIVFFEVFDLSGNQQKYQKRVVVSAEL